MPALTPEGFAIATGVEPSTLATLASYRDMIVLWNDRMNLVGPSFLQDFWRRHALDSAQLFHVEHQAPTWADIGAGAGFPGVVLAILLKGRAEGHVVLVESIGKRVQFLREVVATLGLPASIHHGRAEALVPIPKVEVVTARACAPLTRLLGYTEAFFRKGARGSFLKGRTAEQEIVEARQSWTFDVELASSQSDPSGHIVRLRELARRG